LYRLFHAISQALKRIFRKLEVSSRTQAIARLQDSNECVINKFTSFGGADTPIRRCYNRPNRIQ
jgi:hypothetical protein